MFRRHSTFLYTLGIASALCSGRFCLHAQSQLAQNVAASSLRNQALSLPPAGAAHPLSFEEQGDALMASGSYAKALETYQQAQPRSAVVWNKIGIAYHHLFAIDQALSDYRMAVSLDPHYSEAYNNIGAVLYGKHEFSAAEKAYKRALKYQPTAASTYSNLGTLYFAMYKYKKGSNAYQKALALDPGIFRPGRQQTVAESATREQRMSTAFYLAEVYASAGRKDEALASLRQALLNGFNNRKRLMEDKELASLRDTPEFHKLLLDDHLE